MLSPLIYFMDFEDTPERMLEKILSDFMSTTYYGLAEKLAGKKIILGLNPSGKPNRRVKYARILRKDSYIYS